MDTTNTDAEMLTEEDANVRLMYEEDTAKAQQASKAIVK